MSHPYSGLLARIVGILGLLLVLFGAGTAGAAAPVAHAVLFYSPTCPHCHVVMTEVLPPLQKQYGDQLSIVNVDVTQTDGQAIYQTMVSTFGVSQDRLGVPTLVFGKEVLVGELEIPSRLPGLITSALAAGGNNWPPISGFDAWLSAHGTNSTSEQSSFQRDPLGSSLALILLLVMVASAVAVLLNARPPFDREMSAWRERAVPILAALGIAVACYLAFIEMTGSDAVCGPVGDCNAVQQSPYARLFGILPIGILGVIGYIVIVLAWGLRRVRGQVGDMATYALPGLVFLGVIFSIYLTFLEPFVIGAVCMWCLSSAALMTELLWVTMPRHAPQVRRGKRRRVGAH
jgi:uncharacterized membrane protein